MKGFDRKLFFGVIFIVLLFLPVLGTSIYSLNKVIAAQKKIEKYAEQLVVANDLRREKIQQISLMPIYVLRGDEAILKEMNRSTVLFVHTATKLQDMTDDPKTKKLLETIKEEQKNMSALVQPGIQMKRDGVDTEKINAYFGETTEPKTLSIMNGIEKVVNNITDDYEAEKSNNDLMSHNILTTLAFATALSILLSLLVGALLMKLIKQKKVYDNANEILTKRERELSNARKETVEVVAHDLKNPLSSILMGTQLHIRREKLNPEKNEESLKALERTMRSAESMKRLIDDLLDHAKIESGTLVLDKKVCNLTELLHLLCGRFEPILNNKKINFHCSISASLPTIKIDGGRIEQVISNIMGNAIKFTPEYGTIKMTAETRDNNIYIAVTDNGPGMSKEQTTHIFERYWQVSETAKKGTGLGLAISKAIILAHGGKIKVKSELGVGSTFSMLIPILDFQMPYDEQNSHNHHNKMMH